MSVWLRLNKREAARKKGILCLSIIVCSLFLTHKKTPSLLLFHIFVHAIPLPSLFYTSCWLVSWYLLSWILIPRSTLTISLPLLFSFSLQDTGSTRLFTLQPSCTNKSHSLMKIKSLMENLCMCPYKSHIGHKIKRISGQACYFVFVFKKKSGNLDLKNDIILKHGWKSDFRSTIYTTNTIVPFFPLT